MLRLASAHACARRVRAFGRQPRMLAAPARAQHVLSSLPSTPPLIWALLSANCALFAAAVYGDGTLRRVIRLNTVLSWRQWQRGAYHVALTHAFAHTSGAHLVLNCFTLWSFGCQSVPAMGPRRFATFYALGAIGGAAGHLASSALIPRSRFPAAAWARRDDAAVGASSAIAAVVMRSMALSPWSETLLFAFIPIPNWALASAFVVGSMYGLLYTHERQSISHAGHLGGAAVGLVSASAAMRARRGLAPRAFF